MSTLKVTNIQDTSGGNSLTTAQIYNGAAKAWVNFNGQGAVAIRSQFNVNTITDNGVGSYQVNMTNALSDGNYAVVAVNHVLPGTNYIMTHVNFRRSTDSNVAPTTTTFWYGTSIPLNTDQDITYNYIAVFR